MARNDDTLDLDRRMNPSQTMSAEEIMGPGQPSIMQRAQARAFYNFFNKLSKQYNLALGPQFNGYDGVVQRSGASQTVDLDEQNSEGGQEEGDEKQDPTQDEEGSLQDGPEGQEEQDPAQDGEGSLQDGPEGGNDDQAKDLDKEDKNKKKDDKGGKGGKGGGIPGKLKDPWDPEVTMEIAKQAGGIVPFPIPYPCPECKKMSLYLDKWYLNGMRLTILFSYMIGAMVITKTCPVQVKDAIQQVHFLCLNAKCKKFAFNAFKYKFVPEMTSGKMESRQWAFASPFPKMSTKDAEKIRISVSNKNKAK